MSNAAQQALAADEDRRSPFRLALALAAEAQYVRQTARFTMPPTRVVLDCNIWDELNVDDTARTRTRELCESGHLEVLVPDTLHQQLVDSPFNGVPDWFPTTVMPDSVFVLDHSRLGQARLGSGQAYDSHKGDSGQVSDAVIVDCADIDADVFVSQDKRARERYARMRDRRRALDYTRFRAEILRLTST